MSPPSLVPSPRSSGPTWRSRALDATRRTLDQADDLAAVWKDLRRDATHSEDDLDSQVALDVLDTLTREMHDLRRRLDAEQDPPSG